MAGPCDRQLCAFKSIKLLTCLRVRSHVRASAYTASAEFDARGHFLSNYIDVAYCYPISISTEQRVEVEDSVQIWPHTFQLPHTCPCSDRMIFYREDIHQKDNLITLMNVTNSYASFYNYPIPL